jgi:hypothetical protein
MSSALKSLPPLPKFSSIDELTSPLMILKKSGDLEGLKNLFKNNIDLIDTNTIKSLKPEIQESIIKSLKNTEDLNFLGKIITKFDPSTFKNLTSEQLEVLAKNDEFITNLSQQSIKNIDYSSFNPTFTNVIKNQNSFKSITDGQWWFKFKKANPEAINNIHPELGNDITRLEKVWTTRNFRDLDKVNIQTEFLRATIDNININSFKNSLPLKTFQKFSNWAGNNIKLIIFIGITTPMIIGASICAAGGEDFGFCLGKQAGKVIGTTASVATNIGTGTIDELFPSIKNKVGEYMNNLAEKFPNFAGVFEKIYTYFFLIVFIIILLLILN